MIKLIALLIAAGMMAGAAFYGVHTSKYGLSSRHGEKRKHVKTFDMISRPVKLKYGQVHNTVQEPIKLDPKIVELFDGKTMDIVDYNVDIIFEDGSQAPLSDGYNHHYLMGMGSYDDMKAFYDKHVNDPYGGYDDQAEEEVHASAPQMNMHGLMRQFIDTDLNEGGRAKGRAAGFGGGSGAEERGVSHALAPPFSIQVDSPQAFMPLLHLINTKGANKTEAGYSPLLECPCTAQRSFNDSNGFIDGRPPVPPFKCNQVFMDTENPSCSYDLYEGGFRCCEHGVFVVDTDEHPPEASPETTYFFKFTMSYLDIKHHTWHHKYWDETRAVRPPACCDVTGNLTLGGNVEFDVPQCAAGTAPEHCLYEMSTVQYIDQLDDYHKKHPIPGYPDKDSEIELAYAIGHLHVGGISIDLYDDESGELLCHSRAIYGDEPGEPGNEEGYLVGMTSCKFGKHYTGSHHDRPKKPIKMKRSTKVRTVARYNNTEPHHGVMALWLLQVADVKKHDAVALDKH